jgi:hypothetical protein
VSVQRLHREAGTAEKVINRRAVTAPTLPTAATTPALAPTLATTALTADQLGKSFDHGERSMRELIGEFRHAITHLLLIFADALHLL